MWAGELHFCQHHKPTLMLEAQDSHWHMLSYGQGNLNTLTLHSELRVLPWSIQLHEDRQRWAGVMAQSEDYNKQTFGTNQSSVAWFSYVPLNAFIKSHFYHQHEKSRKCLGPIPRQVPPGTEAFNYSCLSSPQQEHSEGPCNLLPGQIAPAAGLEANDDVSDLQIPLLLQMG